jgi:rod shape-determining protein MreC
MLEKTRLQGVLRGTPDGSIVLERVMSDEKVSPGDVVLSSGGEQIFPKGLPVGTVTKVSPGHEMFLNIQVKPAADLSRLEEVLVITQRQEPSAPIQSTGRVRAADILAQRLPSVPDKPPDSAAPGAAGSKPNTTSAAESTPKQQTTAVSKPVVGLQTSVGSSQSTPSAGVAKSVAEGVEKSVPNEAAGSKPDGSKPGGQNAADQGPGQSTASQTSRKSAPNAPASAPERSAGPTDGSNNTGPAVRPAKAQAKPSTLQPAPASATEDDPH